MAERRTMTWRTVAGTLLVLAIAGSGCVRWTTAPVPPPAPAGVLAARPLRVVFLGRQYPYEPPDFFPRLQAELNRAAGRPVAFERVQPDTWFETVKPFPKSAQPPKDGELTVLLQPIAMEAFYKAHLGPEWPERLVTMIVPIADSAPVTWSATFYTGPTSPGEQMPITVTRHELAWWPAVVVAPGNFVWEQNANDVLLEVLPQELAAAAARMPAGS